MFDWSAAHFAAIIAEHDVAMLLPVGPGRCDVGRVLRSISEEVPLLDELGVLIDIHKIFILRRETGIVAECELNDVSPFARLCFAFADVFEVDTIVEEFVWHEHPVRVIDPRCVAAVEHFFQFSFIFNLFAIDEGTALFGIEVYENDNVLCAAIAVFNASVAGLLVPDVEAIAEELPFDDVGVIPCVLAAECFHDLVGEFD